MILIVIKKKHIVRTPKSFQSIVERFPIPWSKDGEKKQQFAPTRSNASNRRGHDFVNEAEEPPHELDRAHYVLANSIDMLEQGHDDNGPFTLKQRANLPGVVVNDAQDLASRILPAQIVDLLQLHSNSPEAIGSAHIDEMTELRSLYLLIHAYDVTDDKPLKSAVEYIMKEMTPRNVEILQEAYHRGTESGESIINQFRQLSALIDSELHDNPLDTDEASLDDKLHLLEIEPGAIDSTRAVGIAAMKATNGRNMDPFVKLYLKDVAKKQRATHASRSSK
jgi:hypothetical protein